MTKTLFSKTMFCVPFCLKVTTTSRERGFFETKHVSTNIHLKAFFSQESQPPRSRKKENKQREDETIRRSRLLEKTRKGESNSLPGTTNISTSIASEYRFNSKSKKVLPQSSRSTKKAASALKAGLVAYQVTNDRFLKPSLANKKTRGYALRKAVSAVKPCVDLRQVRRGRKTFQIPRVIPPAKRQLFGVRRLLSILSASARKGVEISVKSKDFTFKKGRGVADVNRDGISSSQKNRGNESSANVLPFHNVVVNNTVLHNPESTITDISSTAVSSSVETNSESLNVVWQTPAIEKDQALWSKRDVFTNKRSHTRTTREKESKPPSLSLSYAIGNEVRACSRSRSRAVESKKRIYRVASANRGSIRMSWWL